MTDLKRGTTGAGKRRRVTGTIIRIDDINDRRFGIPKQIEIALENGKRIQGIAPLNIVADISVGSRLTFSARIEPSIFGDEADHFSYPRSAQLID